MVAFELARVFETATQNADAAKWYTTAAERFRRNDWKTKAQQAATRLGGESVGDSQLDFPQLVPPRTSVTRTCETSPPKTSSIVQPEIEFLSDATMT